MKTNILVIATIFMLASCSKSDVKQDPIAQLPPETQTGANTFGVTINGKVYIPRDPTGNGGGLSSKGLIFWGTSNNTWNDIDIKDGASSKGFKMIIHLKDLENLGVGKFILKQSNFQNGIDCIPINQIYFKIWDSNISNYAYYGSIDDLGEVNVTKFEGSYSSDWILSGNFKGKFSRNDNTNDIIEINDGRFDLNLNTLPNAKFP